ncbi:MAG: hypothetical protein SGPRY_012467, partial [Prymnesium sp.]
MDEYELSCRARSLRKKIRQVTLLQDALEHKVTINEEQRRKMAAKPQLVAELQAIEQQLSELRRASTSPIRNSDVHSGSGDVSSVASAVSRDGTSTPCAPAADGQAVRESSVRFAQEAATGRMCRLTSWKRGLRRTREVDVHFDAVCALWWDDDVVVTGSWDTSVKMCHLHASQDEEVVCSWGGHAGKVRAVSMLRHSSVVVSGSADCSIRLWSANAGMLSRVYVYAPLHGLDVFGERALTALDDGTVKLWQLENGCEERCVGRHGEAVTSVHWHTPHTAFSTSTDAKATLWDLRQPAGNAAELTASAPLLTGCSDVVGGLMVAADEDGVLSVWDVRRGATPIATLKPSQPGWVARGLAIGGQTAITCGSRDGGRFGFISVLDLSGGGVCVSEAADTPPLGALSATAERALFGCRDGRVFLYDVHRSSDPSLDVCTDEPHDGSLDAREQIVPRSTMLSGLIRHRMGAPCDDVKPMKSNARHSTQMNQKQRDEAYER